jgi:hypothetical protein
VKSLTIDTWSKEQVDNVKQMGNLKSNAIYNPNIRRHPPPVNLEESERDSEMERFIRAKYEFKRFMERDGRTSAAELRVREGASVLRSKTAPLPSQATPSLSTSQVPEQPKKPVFGSTTLQYRPSTKTTAAVASTPSTSSNPFPAATAPASPAAPSNSNNPVWNDLISLQMDTSQAAQPPLQYASPSLPSTLAFQPGRSASLGAMAFGGSYGSTPSLSAANPFPVAASQTPVLQPSLGVMSNITGMPTSQVSLAMSPTAVAASPFPQAFGGTLAASPSPSPFQPQPQVFQPQSQPALFQAQSVTPTPVFSQPTSTSPFPQQLSPQPAPMFHSPSPPFQSPSQPVLQPQQVQAFGTSQPQMFGGQTQNQFQSQPMGQTAFMQSMMPQRQGTAGFGVPQQNNPFGQWRG